MAQAETEIQINELLRKMTRACTDSARELHRAMRPENWEGDMPMVYTMPRMELSLKMALSYSESKVKGILLWKSQDTKAASALSEIKVELVAVPRQE